MRNRRQAALKNRPANAIPTVYILTPAQEKLARATFLGLAEYAGGGGYLARELNINIATANRWYRAGIITRLGAVQCSMHPLISKKFKYTDLRPDVSPIIHAQLKKRILGGVTTGRT